MTAFEDVFERTEKKYLIDPAQRRMLEGALRASHSVDGYGTSTVTSVYWDTPWLSVISRSLEKPLYKEKVRARAYGTEAAEALVEALEGNGVRPEALGCPVFMELKKKYDGVVYKRRVGLSLGALMTWIEGDGYRKAVMRFPLRECPEGEGEPPFQCMAPKSLQIARELQAAMDRFSKEGLGPAMAIACERTAFIPKPETSQALGRLRATFDENLRFKPLSSHDSAEAAMTNWEDRWFPLLTPGCGVMELKCQGPLDRDLSRLLSRLRVFPQSFSKYGAAARSGLVAPGWSGSAEGKRSFAGDPASAVSGRRSWESPPLESRMRPCPQPQPCA